MKKSFALTSLFKNNTNSFEDYPFTVSKSNGKIIWTVMNKYPCLFAHYF